MRTELKPHPTSRPAAARRIEVEILHPAAAALELHYRLEGAIGDLLLPVRSAAARADGLWRHSCFEAFIRAADSRSYYEFNFSPSMQWAAYRFDGYREGMRNVEALEVVPIEVDVGRDSFALKVILDLSKVSDLDPRHGLQLNLTAIVEEKDGTKSYWALAHPVGAADFHHPDCFVLQLPAATSP